MKQVICRRWNRTSRLGLVIAGASVFVTLVQSSQGVAADSPSPHHSTMDTKSPAPEKVNPLLAKADADIRAGLLRLSEKFPQLKTTNFHTLAKDLEKKPEVGTVDVSVGHYSGSKGGLHTPVAKEDTFDVTVFLRRERPADNDPNAPAPQWSVEHVYKHLGLVGHIRTSAGDEKLDAALKKLVDEALAPLAKLEKETQ